MKGLDTNFIPWIPQELRSAVKFSQPKPVS